MHIALAFTLLLAPAQDAGATAPACERIAQSAREADRARVVAEFWTDVAVALASPADRLSPALRAAWAARGEGQALAERSYAARLELCVALGHGAYAPRLDPAQFSADVDARWFPLPPGRRLLYRRLTAEGEELTRVTVSDRVRLIAGVPCRPVETEHALNGVMTESTTEFFSQHMDGSVWLFGELDRQIEDGEVIGMEGSWRAGVEGARPGVQMPATPVLGATFRMQYVLGVAEDVGRVVAVGVTVTVPAGTFQDCVGVEEWSPLEPDDVAVKYYAPGVGWVLEEDASGGRTELVRAD